MRICLLLSVSLLAVGCLREGIDRTQQGLGGYEPPEPAATVCNCPADGGHGACNIDCNDILCDTGFDNCDGRLDNGCEAKLDDPATCGSCSNNCHECRDHAVCNAGECEGKARPDDSACRSPGCATVGMCREGDCLCPMDGVDMARGRKPPPIEIVKTPPNDGHGLPGDCSFTGGGTATASVLLLLGAVILLFRRRRSS